MADKRKQNGGHSTKPRDASDKRLLTKAESEKANEIFVKALKEIFEVDNDNEAKVKFIKETLLESQRGQLFVAEHIFGKAPQEINQLNYNVDEKDLDEAEIKRIRYVIESKF